MHCCSYRNEINNMRHILGRNQKWVQRGGLLSENTGMSSVAGTGAGCTTGVAEKVTVTSVCVKHTTLSQAQCNLASRRKYLSSEGVDAGVDVTRAATGNSIADNGAVCTAESAVNDSEVRIGCKLQPARGSHSNRHRILSSNTIAQRQGRHSRRC